MRENHGFRRKFFGRGLQKKKKNGEICLGCGCGLGLEEEEGEKKTAADL